MNNKNLIENKFKRNSANSYQRDSDLENFTKEVLTPLGDIYIVNEKTNEKFIKGTKRGDGTLRKNIRVRSDYMPQEENCAYKVGGYLLKEPNKNRNLNININSKIENKVHERKIPGWNPVNEHENRNINNLKKKKEEK